jgi:ABC-type glutathione transport system ATPase component
MTAALDNVDTGTDLHVTIDFPEANRRVVPCRARELKPRRIACPRQCQMAALNDGFGIRKQVSESSVVRVEVRNDQAIDILR